MMMSEAVVLVSTWEIVKFGEIKNSIFAGDGVYFNYKRTPDGIYDDYVCFEYDLTVEFKRYYKDIVMLTSRSLDQERTYSE